MNGNFVLKLVAVLYCLAALSAQSDAQRIRFPTNVPPVQTQPGLSIPSNTIPPGNVIPPFGSMPAYNGSPQYSPPPTNTFPAPTFPQPPAGFGAANTVPALNGFQTQPGILNPPNLVQPGFTGSVQPMIAPPNGSALPTFSQTPQGWFPKATGPTWQDLNAPAATFNGGITGPATNSPTVAAPNQSLFAQPLFRLPELRGPSTWFKNWQWPNWTGSGSTQGSRDWIGRSFWSQFEKGQHLRLLQELRLGHTWLWGSENNQVQMHSTELGTTLNYPNFLSSGQPLRISPGFIFHSWDGPQPPPATITADLPSRAYSTFLGFDWSSTPARSMGLDVNFSTGLYTDFEAMTSDALRFKGTALGRLRVAPDLTFRFGVTYLDRLRFKLLPAVGFFWTPTADARMELFFPYPKLARRIPSIGNADTWTYVRAELGGDTFSIERASGIDDQVDIVDYRVLGGIEWNGYDGSSGFLEAGYVFNRDLYYRLVPADNLSLDDTFVIRTGLSY